ncbi:hypothetical protein [Neosynechococcus sphagnicola]|nr:hypothetical protein [Neosynechococcus sphagnicola]
MAALEARGLLLRTLAVPSCVRACVHYFTQPADIDCLMQAIGELQP